MEVRKRITAIVPSELLYVFDPDHEHVFVVTREKGKIVARPMEEFASGGKGGPSNNEYRKGYMSGVVDGYEDGYRQGYNDCFDNDEFDPRYRGKKWLATDEVRDDHQCMGDCWDCRYYDEIFRVCRVQNEE